MRNIVPGMGIKLIIFVVMASVLIVTPHRFPDITLSCRERQTNKQILMPPPDVPVYRAHFLGGQCKLLHSSPWNLKYFNVYDYIFTVRELTYMLTQGRSTSYTVCALSKILIMPLVAWEL